jgi:hypothetical protein
MGQDKKGQVEQAFKARPEYAGIRVVVETGTFRGEGARVYAGIFDVVETIELNKGYHDRAVELSDGFNNINFYLGDSAALLPALCQKHDEPVLFALDAHNIAADIPKHYNDIEAYENVPEGFPLWEELNAILARGKADLIIVDDTHAFCKKRDDLRVEGMGDTWEKLSFERLKAIVGDRLAGTLCVPDGYAIFLKE